MNEMPEVDTYKHVKFRNKGATNTYNWKEGGSMPTARHTTLLAQWLIEEVLLLMIRTETLIHWNNQETRLPKRFHETCSFPQIFTTRMFHKSEDCRSVCKNFGSSCPRCFFFFLRSFFLAEGLFWMTVLLGSLQAAPFLYRRLRMCMKGWAKSKPQLLRGGLGDGW